MKDKYDTKIRTRQTFVLTGREHRGARAGNERLVCHVQNDRGLLAVWGTARADMRHIDALEAEIARADFPITIECDWIPPDPYEAQNFNHRYWVWQTDHFAILKG
ncbi:MAG: hypothetical protein AB7G23_08950 [Vicinamibacterales bacterium]